jgi:hypothetical protein
MIGSELESWLNPGGTSRIGRQAGTPATFSSASCRWSRRNFKRIGAIGVAKVGIRILAAATILEHGTDCRRRSSCCVF